MTGQDGTYRYHVRTDEQVNSDDYCDGTSAAIKWNYVLGCYHGDLTLSQVTDSTTAALPSDCVVASDEAPDVPTMSPSPSLPPAPPPSPSSDDHWSPYPPSLPAPTDDAEPIAEPEDHPACEYEYVSDACPMGTECTCYPKRARSLLFSSVPSWECYCM